MSLRVLAVYVIVVSLSVYAWKDWFKSLCGLIVLVAVVEYRGMPRSVLGIQGLNPWNVLFLSTVLAWAASRSARGLTWDMPRRLSIVLLLYLGVILFGFLRALFDRSYIEDYPLTHLISEELINTLKWACPGVLLFDGCRTRKQVIMALACVLVLYLLIALQTTVNLPLGGVLSDSDTMNYARVKLNRRMGYNASDVSTMLAGASWGMLAVLPLIRKKRYWPAIFMMVGLIFVGQALTGGRAGYIAWAATGFVLCVLKWRKQLILVPVLLLLLPIVFPSAVDRMFAGFGETDAAGQATVDDYAMTSGRLVAWPRVIDKIGESPLIGHGRLGMRRTGVSARLMADLNESFPHPHNVYLETLLDNGILGSLPICAFWGIVIMYSARLFRNANHLYSAVGGLTLSLTLAQVVGGIGSQHYFPRESTMALWTSAFLAIRVFVEEKQSQTMTSKVGMAGNGPPAMSPQEAILPSPRSTLP